MANISVTQTLNTTGYRNVLHMMTTCHVKKSIILIMDNHDYMYFHSDDIWIAVHVRIAQVTELCHPVLMIQGWLSISEYHSYRITSPHLIDTWIAVHVRIPQAIQLIHLILMMHGAIYSVAFLLHHICLL